MLVASYHQTDTAKAYLEKNPYKIVEKFKKSIICAKNVTQRHLDITTVLKSLLTKFYLKNTPSIKFEHDQAIILKIIQVSSFFHPKNVM